MNNAYVMAASIEAKYRSKASMITAGFAAFMIILMFLLKWDMTAIIKVSEPPTIEVELNLPDEPEPPVRGGGGGGNPVQATGPAGIAKAVPPAPGDKDDSKDIEDNPKESVVVNKPVAPKPKATKITNTSIVKAEPKPVVETP